MHQIMGKTRLETEDQRGLLADSSAATVPETKSKCKI